MMKHIAKLFALITVLFLAAESAFSQQITRFAVIDTARIYAALNVDSKNVQELEARKERYQSEIQKLSDEIKELRQQKVDAEALGERTKAARLEAQINSKTDYLMNYSRSKNEELEKLRQNLGADSSFYSRLYNHIRRIGEAEGYSMVLSLQDGNSIIWYSPTVDITDRVIRSMRSSN